MVIGIIMMRPRRERHLLLVLSERAREVEACGGSMHVANVVEARLVHGCVVGQGIHLVGANLVRIMQVVQGCCYPRRVVPSHTKVFRSAKLLERRAANANVV